jgi:hypothetical protein
MQSACDDDGAHPSSTSGVDQIHAKAHARANGPGSEEGLAEPIRSATAVGCQQQWREQKQRSMSHGSGS